MASDIKLVITAGPMKGKEFSFKEHDTLLCGRNKDCHIVLADDPQISRHHCLWEINPPEIRIRDLGSKNGTNVNGQKYGGRQKHENPEEGAQREYPQADLKDGDEVRLGQTTFTVHVRGEVGAKSVVKADEQPVQELGQIRHTLRVEHTEAQFSDYVIERKLGAGGMGAVYLVKHKRLGSLAALKVMLAKIAADETSRHNFWREMEATRALRHRNVVNFLGGGMHENSFYFLTEFCEGSSLDQVLKRLKRPLTLQEAAPIMIGALEGLAFVHAQGFVHRDLKPHNLLLAGREGNWTAKIGDLGLAKNFIEAGYSGMTATGSYAGSFPYMPREQMIHFKYCKPVSDVWSLGATYYFLLSGKYPRKQTAGQDPIGVILKGELVPLKVSTPQLPEQVCEVIDRSLLNDSKQRYQDAGEMLVALRKVVGGG